MWQGSQGLEADIYGIKEHFLDVGREGTKQTPDCLSQSVSRRMEYSMAVSCLYFSRNRSTLFEYAGNEAGSPVRSYRLSSVSRDSSGLVAVGFWKIIFLAT